ncbi:MAG: ClbS/DfsB family four-helix bundle protein [Desulfobacterales bacterium]|nr:ClbS/DfsB family four-helix bundle protein [Desulfobacterales bacterium]
MTSVPQNKQELLNAIQVAVDKLHQDFSGIPEKVTREQSIEGNIKGTMISVCDTLAYLIGWGKLVLKWHARSEQDLHVDFPETGYKWNELGPLARSFHEKYQAWTYPSLLDEHKATMQEMVRLVDRLDNHTLYEVAWYKKWTLGRMIQFNTSSPMKNMRTKIRKFKSANGIN